VGIQKCRRGGGGDRDQVGTLEAAQGSGEVLAGVGFALRAGQPDQHRDRLGGGGELGVTVELGGHPGQRFGAEVQFEEPLERPRSNGGS
jgi:hypothetical protein